MIQRFFGFFLIFLGIGLGLATAQEAPSADPEPLFEAPLDGLALGIFAGIHRGTVDAGFAVDSRGLTQDTECGQYDGGTSTGYLVGVHGELPVTSFIGVQALAGIALREASMRYPCVDLAGTRMPDGSVVPAVTEFRSDASYTLITLDVGATFRPITLPVLASLGPTLSILTRADYDAREVIVTPREASFVNGGGQEREIGEGSFGSGDVSLGLRASIWYEAPIGGRWWIVPRVAGTVALSDEIAAGDIRGTGLEATLGITYRFPPRTREASPIEAGATPGER